jgi:acetyltransferase-like isoleucine patch superfamily enzyme
VITDIHVPIKDQGIVKTPVRIGPDCWVGTKVSVLRGTRVGRGCVLGAHAVVRGTIPDYAIAVGSPARVVRNRKDDYAADADRRAALADIARKHARAVQESLKSLPD